MKGINPQDPKAQQTPSKASTREPYLNLMMLIWCKPKKEKKAENQRKKDHYTKGEMIRIRNNEGRNIREQRC